MSKRLVTHETVYIPTEDAVVEDMAFVEAMFVDVEAVAGLESKTAILGRAGAYLFQRYGTLLPINELRQGTDRMQPVVGISEFTVTKENTE